MVIYFVTNTKHCGKTKLYKLLFFADFEHYSEIGRSISGLSYYAWPMGPVPKDLHDDIEDENSDLREYLSLETKIFGGTKTKLDIKPLTQFDESLFSKRELGLLESLSKEYYRTNAGEMVEESHLENLPWHQVFEVEKKPQTLISYDLAFKKAELEVMQSLSSEHQEIVNNYT